MKKVAKEFHTLREAFNAIETESADPLRQLRALSFVLKQICFAQGYDLDYEVEEEE